MQYNVLIKDTKTNDILLFKNGYARTDKELFEFLGWCSVKYFLQFDTIDHEDAFYYDTKDEHIEDRILWFTCHKANDSESKGHRHGLNRNLLGYGEIWSYGIKRTYK